LDSREGRSVCSSGTTKTPSRSREVRTRPGLRAWKPRRGEREEEEEDEEEAFDDGDDGNGDGEGGEEEGFLFFFELDAVAASSAASDLTS